ncbi:hypothetical protein JOD29_002026 [Lysinibacillus composti]|uniref:DUF4279 domain-containing protein n=1 Tax=Lysinibacillus composti TaxID=720633 RepID=A0A3N9UQ75_9BACI|nr:DUF4279 domain-containing protein [Lysinibacillus composti]MBM7608779.1 hypothetical protein [Lysinibacillus composti]RQW74682.1 DUF4279 domain-containing protein [Lysinibacillus composti]
MNKTQVNVYFSLYGDEFPIKEVTEKLKVIPTKTYKKGDLIPNRSKIRYRKETSWDLGTGYQNSLDVNKQLQEILGKLQNKTLIINEIKDTYSLECKIFIVIKIENGNTPALYMDREIIKFASSIEAEIDVDLYANPYESDFKE